jgi:hypothetical protein
MRRAIASSIRPVQEATSRTEDRAKGRVVVGCEIKDRSICTGDFRLT